MLIAAKIIGLLLTPPAIFLLLALLGLILQWRWRKLGVALVALSVIGLLIFSLPITGFLLLRGLEAEATPLPKADASLSNRGGVIVVLGGGRHESAPEYGGDTVSGASLERLRYAARLHRATGLPLLVSGGTVYGETVSEATLMQQVLTEDFHTPARWVESRSRNTQENADYTRTILETAGIKRVLLVTHAWHMRRAVWAFHNAGLEVTMAPTAFITTANAELPAFSAMEYLPTASALSLTGFAVQERLGLLWYRLRYHKSAEEPATNSR
ncbi:MAG: YdcF family protein [Gammaproteobacteria bacterium]|nr:YdcF family protein [Gammaproteobacteria bacterium]